MTMTDARVVTPKQLEEGWIEFRRDGVPNTIHHDFVVIRKLPDGNYVVREPEVQRSPECAA